jgi:hypothetical protein
MKKFLLSTTACLFLLSAAASASEYRHPPARPQPKPTAPTVTHNTTTTINEPRSTAAGIGHGGAGGGGGAGGAATSHGSTAGATSHGSQSSANREGDKNLVLAPPGIPLASSGDCVESFSVSLFLGAFARSYRCPMLNLTDALRAQHVYGDSRDPHVQALLARMRSEALGSDDYVPDDTRDYRGGQ